MTYAAQVADFDVYHFVKKHHSKAKKKEDQIISDATNLFNKIRTAITKKNDLKGHQPLLEELYALRVKVVSWLLENRLFSELEEGLREGVRFNDSLRSDKRFIMLSENIFYALKAKMYFMEALNQADKDFLVNNSDTIQHQMPRDYNNLMVSISRDVKKEEDAQNIFDFLNSSLEIEFVLIAASIAHEEKLKITDNILKELSYLVVDAAQKFSGIFISTVRVSNAPDFSQEKLDKNFIKDQQLLADHGLEDLMDV